MAAAFSSLLSFKYEMFDGDHRKLLEGKSSNYYSSQFVVSFTNLPTTRRTTRRLGLITNCISNHTGSFRDSSSSSASFHDIDLLSRLPSDKPRMGMLILVEALQREGVTDVFTHQGIGIHTKALSASPSITTHTFHLPHNDFHAALNYAHATGIPGVCLTSWFSCFTEQVFLRLQSAYHCEIPMVVIVLDGLEWEYERIFRDKERRLEEATKRRFRVRSAEDIPRIVRTAFEVATSGIPGPVLIDYLDSDAQAFTVVPVWEEEQKPSEGHCDYLAHKPSDQDKCCDSSAHKLWPSGSEESDQCDSSARKLWPSGSEESDQCDSSAHKLWPSGSEESDQCDSSAHKLWPSGSEESDQCDSSARKLWPSGSEESDQCDSSAHKLWPSGSEESDQCDSSAHKLWPSGSEESDQCDSSASKLEPSSSSKHQCDSTCKLGPVESRLKRVVRIIKKSLTPLVYARDGFEYMDELRTFSELTGVPLVPSENDICRHCDLVLVFGMRPKHSRIPNFLDHWESTVFFDDAEKEDDDDDDDDDDEDDDEEEAEEYLLHRFQMSIRCGCMKLMIERLNHLVLVKKSLGGFDLDFSSWGEEVAEIMKSKYEKKKYTPPVFDMYAGEVIFLKYVNHVLEEFQEGSEFNIVGCYGGLFVFENRIAQGNNSHWGIKKHALAPAAGCAIGERRKRRASGDGGGDKEAIVVSILDEENILSNIAELAVLRRENIPVKVVVINFQILSRREKWMKNRFLDTEEYDPLKDNQIFPETPDFPSIARAFGVPSARITKREEVTDAMRVMMETPGPYLLDIIVPLYTTRQLEKTLEKEIDHFFSLSYYLG